MEDRFQSSNFIDNELLSMPAESQINPNARVVLSYELKNWEYMAAEVYIDDNGELKLRDNGGMIQIGPITLLYQVDFDDNNNVINSNPLEAANVYLMYQKIRNDAKCVSLAYRALKHYFSFIADENTTRRQNGQPELLWNEMPIRKSERATYRYKRCLEDCYKSKDPNIHLAWSTCNAYINRVVDSRIQLRSAIPD